ncbi:Dolichyl-phosphate beta-glucosyltransferase [Trichinella spiralis]|uniref:Dolichyl-phosphate beta-glucosyltransferase n=1 Tax=Trichinella spiralis TaxID=6334 RepID=A0ABR3KKE3_TRISP
MYVRYEEENFFIDPSDVKKKLKCPSIDDEPSVYLSVIIPAKDEEKRLPKMLDQCIDYLHTRSVKDPKFTYEIIVVDDGSSDRTAEVTLNYSQKYTVQIVRLLKLRHNRGKGGAVRLGVLCARVETAMEELCQSLGTSKALAVGSRAHLKEESVNCTRYTVWLQIVYTRCSGDTVSADAHGRKFQSAGQKLKAPS